MNTETFCVTSTFDVRILYPNESRNLSLSVLNSFAPDFWLVSYRERIDIKRIIESKRFLFKFVLKNAIFS